MTEYTVTGLDAGNDYSFLVTALTPDEGPQSESLTFRAAGFPVTPATIMEIAGTRTGQTAAWRDMWREGD